MSPEQLLQALQDEGIKVQSIGQKYGAQTQLFQAACLENNGQQADAHREQLHALLDLLLDSISTCEMLKRQFITRRF